jgi:hypothetical protein
VPSGGGSGQPGGGGTGSGGGGSSGGGNGGGDLLWPPVLVDADGLHWGVGVPSGARVQGALTLAKSQFSLSR